MKLLYVAGIVAVGIATFGLLLRDDIADRGGDPGYDVADTASLLFVSFMAGMFWPLTVVGAVGYWLLRKLTDAINEKADG